MRAHQWTLDLLSVLALGVAAAAGILVFDLTWTPIRLALSLPLVLLLPGYAFVSALFPERADDGFSLLERLVLSVGLSLAIVSVAAYVANFTPYGIRLAPVAIAVVGWTVVFAVIGLVRRARYPPQERYRIRWTAGDSTLPALFSVQQHGINTQRGPFEPENERQLLLNVFLVFSVLVLIVGGAYLAVAAPSLPDTEPHTEYYLLAENGDGELVANALPTELSTGSAEPIYVGIENHEGETQTYTTVVLQQQVTLTDDGSEIESVNGEEELDRFETTVQNGETERVGYELSPTASGDVHVWFLLYQGDVPEDPSPENAYRATRLTVSVS
ncbi:MULTISPECIES: DUF1616 domain-containing protein [Halalkalicoccus]|uniref:DUF1616 domain-containing protein n=1 Tax=Halalkalicoccus TaxID=332246 RepID=UPI002F96DEFA